jgi:hypothetical protein
LPGELCVTSLKPCADDFHPIRSSSGTQYRYRFLTGVAGDPFVGPYSWHLRCAPDWDRFRHEMRSFVGKHDFSSFCASDSSAKTFQRTILDTRLEIDGSVVEWSVTGEGFLKQMVRAMAGTLIELSCGKHPSASVATMLAARDRRQAGITAPAQRLTLVRVFYEPRLDVAANRYRWLTLLKFGEVLDRSFRSYPQSLSPAKVALLRSGIFEEIGYLVWGFGELDPFPSSNAESVDKCKSSNKTRYSVDRTSIGRPCSRLCVGRRPDRRGVRPTHGRINEPLGAATLKVTLIAETRK